MSNQEQFSELLFEAVAPNGEEWRLWADGRFEGFPAGTVLVNHAFPVICKLLAEQERARSGVTNN